MGDFDDKSSAELEAMLNDHSLIPNPDEPAETPVETPPETVAPPVEAPSDTPEVDETPEPEVDERELERQQWKLERERYAAEMEKRDRHASRLAGELGEIKKRVLQTPERESYVSDASSDDAQEALRIARQSEARLALRERDEAVASEIASVKARIGEISPELLEQVGPKHLDAFVAAKDEPDPETARLAMRSVLYAIAADVREIELEAKRSASKERKAEQTRALGEAKRKASVSASGSAPPPPQGQKAIADMSPAELAQEMRRLTAR